MIRIVLNNPDTVVDFHEREIENCLNHVLPLMKKERALMELQGNITYIGDTHGDFETTKAIITRYVNKDHLVFLGDYIDREPIKWGSICNITYLLCLKYWNPHKFVLLKGNHETNNVIPCYPYEFEEEIIQKFGSSRLHEKFVEVFSEMPLTTVANNVYGAHGGILKGTDLKYLRTVKKDDVKAITSIVWSDPSISLTFRGAGDSFTAEDLTKFLDGIKAKVFIRGHDYGTLGMSIYGGRCLTICSSSRYKEMGNEGILVATAKKEIFDVRDLIVEDFTTGKWKRYKVSRN
jgi:hypothetical protein